MLESNARHTLSDIIYFYRGQITKFYKIGLGNKTENGVTVTDQLIDITRYRLNELINKKLHTKVGGNCLNGVK
tara:strand:- start:446 stop:664 length:219 start_codon:yes stop_codon:yes gene_type:complete